MARARNIKPGFFANEDLVELPFATRLLFIGLWTVADREGRLEDRPKKIKIAVFPADDIDVDKALSGLQASGFILRYEVSGRGLIQILEFVKHQMPHHKEAASELPPPPGVPAVTRHSYDVTSERRDAIFARDGKCLKCGTTESLSLDHVVSLAKGGDNSDENLQTLCVKCNSSKGDTTKDYRNSNVEPTLIQRSVDVGADSPPDSLIADSLIPPSLIPDSGLRTPDSLNVSPTGEVTTGPSPVAARKTRSRADPPPTAPTWTAYSDAYVDRYGVPPVRNASVNSQLAAFVGKIGVDDAPHVAAFYVRHSKAWYVGATHPVSAMLKDAEGLRTQWATNRKVMVKDAHEADRLASDGDMWNRVQQKLVEAH